MLTALNLKLKIVELPPNCNTWQVKYETSLCYQFACDNLLKQQIDICSISE